MSIEAVRVAVVAGDGAVLRRDEVIVILGAPVSPALVTAVEDALASSVGAARVRSIARLLLDQHADAGGAVIALDDVTEVFALGPFELVVDDGRVTASHHILGLSEQVQLADLVAVVPTGVAVPAVPDWADLVGGATGGVGAVFVSGAATEHSGADPADATPIEPDPEAVPDGPAVAPSPATGPSGRFELVSLTASIDLSDRRPVPVGSDATSETDVDPDDGAAERSSVNLAPYMRPVRVLGVLSPKGHFNHPDAAYCSRSGVKMGASHTKALADGVRPPLGVFTFDDGSTCAVQWNMVIGRDPRGDDRVMAGEAAPYPLSDAELKVSRRHLHVDLVEWDVLIEDLGTANGTYAREGPTDPGHRLAPGERYRLQTGSEIRLGDRSFVYHEHHVR